jgi:anti-sigma factor (TIGR02949 family)
MSLHRLQIERSSPAICTRMRNQFSRYLDGETSGKNMAALARHLEACPDCNREFAGWRTMQQALAISGRAPAPENLQARLRAAIRDERQNNTHLSPVRRWSQLWHDTLAPLALRASGGFALALVLLGGLSWIAAPLGAVEANDDKLAHLNAPHFLYSQVPPQLIVTQNDDTPILIEARIDDRGRVYDFNIISGPTDPGVRMRVQENLMTSIFHPATIFGEPVPGHLMLTYTGVSVRG